MNEIYLEARRSSCIQCVILKVVPSAVILNVSVVVLSDSTVIIIYLSVERVIVPRVRESALVPVSNTELLSWPHEDRCGLIRTHSIFEVEEHVETVDDRLHGIVR